APESLAAPLRGYAPPPLLSTASFTDADPLPPHRLYAVLLDDALTMIADIKRRAREDAAVGRSTPRPAWPMIIFRTPKGWTGPKEVDVQPAEGSWRSHHVPLSIAGDSEALLAVLADCVRSYRA